MHHQYTDTTNYYSSPTAGAAAVVEDATASTATAGTAVVVVVVTASAATGTGVTVTPAAATAAAAAAAAVVVASVVEAAVVASSPSWLTTGRFGSTGVVATAPVTGSCERNAVMRKREKNDFCEERKNQKRPDAALIGYL